MTEPAAAAFRRTRARPGSPTRSLTGQRPPSPSHTRLHNASSGGTFSHVWHHPATLQNRLTVKQVREIRSFFNRRKPRRSRGAITLEITRHGIVSLRPSNDRLVSGGRRKLVMAEAVRARSVFSLMLIWLIGVSL